MKNSRSFHLVYLMISKDLKTSYLEIMIYMIQFNVFLVNKILAVLLLPMIILLAFLDKSMYGTLLIISFSIISILYFNRYLRSWKIFNKFIEFSRFHFFLYLCASELLPMAVILKWLIRGLS